ncbi:hypothetical protein ACMU_18680 [Actibacterium mucosum KCTC 23349]|uniref:Uncharacterized protein n=1 Tax=Actibacterium mucosum KCTC 23349 TaxID=1454373 RepID=A0A037ZDN5_9RHOB|nr:DUF4173 domain-containing protein [Actibacterium mucosum]KAJ54252.1 hypothetical protein ACMU_18680 [Actibacterium mucosum KCTC 23349]
MQTLTLRGVPHRLAMDGWWLSDTPAETPRPRTKRRPGWPAKLALLVPVADILFWNHAPGLSLALFATLIFALSAWGTDRLRAGPVLALLLGALPVVEHVQALSVLFLLGGLTVALAWQHLGDGIAAGVAGLLKTLPHQWVAPLGFPLAVLRRVSLGEGIPFPAVIAVFRNWSVPVGGALIFAALLIEANPVLAELATIEIEVSDLLRRAAFWLGIAMVFSPLLKAPPKATLPAWPGRVGVERFGINAASTLRALIVFNLLIGTHIVIDATFLIGNDTLPEGMSMAEYAHRSAYPLLATALLAGLFALCTRPFWRETPAIRPLMLLWLGLNAVLCLSALSRLQVYVEAYGLTYLRVHAAIWMALVAAGLVLLAWQVVRGHTNRWMLGRLATLAVGVLYLCCFVNFAHLIATSNVNSERRDIRYACSLPATAAGALKDVDTGMMACYMNTPRVDGWRDWGFRNWRVARYVAQTTPAEAMP